MCQDVSGDLGIVERVQIRDGAVTRQKSLPKPRVRRRYLISSAFVPFTR